MGIRMKLGLVKPFENISTISESNFAYNRQYYRAMAVGQFRSPTCSVTRFGEISPLE